MSRRAPPEPSTDDIALFRDAVGPVRRIETEAPAPEKPRPRPRAHMREADEAAVAGDLLRAEYDPALIEIGEELSYLREGHSPKLLRRLKRGQFSIQGETDLHHMNAEAARTSILDLLDEAHTEGWRCVRIVHGKGLRSRPGGPVLKGLTDRLLRRRSDVLAFASARPAQGGTGATVVLLR
ncbi:MULTISPECIES: Smr/MutS family protein [Oleiagrimonas]|uniref:SMR domain protein n=1 Tax=Oleiagrimonas citrea TaxID=1665687 RepID=A0A846ZM95_9GAMM|nr:MULTISPECIES: Smr/MutS family protein [Oleiagrimonas]NKZ39096.1 SMR domain protein [Oleiagrimonas citrea]RAP57702.1 SMR domain protein [Oleiagrimonas sp. MCCC 1A03011]